MAQHGASQPASSKVVYNLYDTVTADHLEIGNSSTTARAVDLRIWLRMPDGQVIPVANGGGDGSFILQGQTFQNWGPVALMGADENLPRGLWEFGCRLLGTPAVLP